jgi:hypothetical protein
LYTAPRYVAGELDATHQALRQARENATMWQARVDADADTLVRDELAAAAAQEREQAARLEAQVEQLEYADHARTVFLAEPAVTRDKAERTRVAAGWKSIDFDNPTDRVTAQEWLTRTCSNSSPPRPTERSPKMTCPSTKCRRSTTRSMVPPLSPAMSTRVASAAAPPRSGVPSSTRTRTPARTTLRNGGTRGRRRRSPWICATPPPDRAHRVLVHLAAR